MCVRHQKWYILLGLTLVLLSSVFYLLHYLIFEDSHHIFIFLLGDIAFLPIEVLLVSLILHKLLNDREKRQLLNKLNMVVGAFFSEVGISLIKKLSGFSRDFPAPRNIDSRAGDLGALRDFLIIKRDFLLRLLENPNLLEHESFTEMLRAVFHLAEELEYRPDVTSLTDPDLNHITEDMDRAYTSLISQWLKYMNHLKDNYPYLYSLAHRVNPLDPFAQVELKAFEKTDV